MELRETILEGTIQAFNKKGLKFTMDDIAALLGISKKTIYTVFQDKNTLVSEMVDYCFDSIKESEQKVLSDTSLDTVGKIRAILGVLPEGYKDIDFRQLYLLKDKYPKIYKKVEQRLETGWETTIALIQQGIHEGIRRGLFRGFQTDQGRSNDVTDVVYGLGDSLALVAGCVAVPEFPGFMFPGGSSAGDARPPLPGPPAVGAVSRSNTSLIKAVG